MRRSLLILTYLLSSFFCSKAQKKFLTKFEISQGNETVTYQEGIQYFENLAAEYPSIQIQTYGETDSGFPIHLAIFSLDKDFNPSSLKQKNKTVLMLNNAIHPGEPDGVDATMLLFRDMAQNTEWQKQLQNTVVIAIPFYNIGGAMNRGSFSRANQNGPLEYGFRGNARNLDLNRDFIKCDSKNARTFTKIFHTWDPDVLIDNHVSNGADYQHVLTLLPTQYNKLGGKLGRYLKTEMLPSLYQQMEAREEPMCPYVNVFGRMPDQGYAQFYDAPRYASGYTTLFQTLGFTTETHMLKPYKDRVKAMYTFMQTMLKYLEMEGKNIQMLRQEQKKQVKAQTNFPLDWKLDSTHTEKISFRGYEGREIKSKVTTGKRLFYDRNKPYTKDIPFYPAYIPKITTKKPVAYIIPKAWKRIISRLQWNNVVMHTFVKPTQLTVKTYYVVDYQTLPQPFEGHYLHSNTVIKEKEQKVQFLKGDYVVYVNQKVNRYIVELLEPQGVDSFFNWNFFDTILQQKEGYSSYVFEEIAEKLLKEDKVLQEKFTEMLRTNPDFAENPARQLYFVYQHSPYYEKEYKRYPVFRLEQDAKMYLNLQEE